jgi:hypothetical protein
MAILRRALLVFAGVWAVSGVAVAVVPRWLLVTWFDQVPYPDYTYVRVCGIAALGTAALALMVSRRLDEVWWWSWAFVLQAGATALATGLHALSTSAEGVWFWWLFAASNAALTAWLVLGIARAGVEEPIV